ncbi:MAG: glutamine synthetase family protein [Parcubacteria group bacterium]
MDEKARELLAQVKTDGVRAVNLQFTDLGGAVKSVTIPSHALANALDKGIWFDGSSIEGFARIHESDMLLRPDPDTYRILPWEPADRKIARIICDVYRPDGRPLPMDPRGILKQVLKRAEKLGFAYNTGSEVEFFLFKDGSTLEPVTHDVGGYFDFSQDEAHAVRMDLMDAFEAMGMQVEMSHHEVAPGQHEIDIRYADALTTADNVITLKYAVKALAAKRGLTATFMPKPLAGINGSGMHTHQSFFKGNENMFYGSKDKKYGLSLLAHYFIAGQLAHARALSAIVAPTVNSYKRLVPGYEAPVYICWARINRSALIRVPQYSPGREQSTRAELRFPDPSCNPYLAFAVMLAAGLDGIERRLLPPQPVEEDVYHFDDARLAKLHIGTLPATLAEALAEFEQDPVLQGALGAKTATAFLRMKRREWDEFRLYVSPWERERYLGTA